MTTTSPWSAGDQYDPELHGQPERDAPSPQRGMALAVAFAGAIILVALGFVAVTLL